MNNFLGNRNLTHQVTHELGLAIVQGHFLHNEPFMTEAQLEKQYQISRSVIREAVKMLTAKGLITSRPRQGIRVQPAAEWNVFDSDVLQWMSQGQVSPALQQEFVEFRRAIEPEAATLAARRQNTGSIQAMVQALEQLQSSEGNRESLLAADIEFHTAVLHASGNRFFTQLTHFMQVALRSGMAAMERRAEPLSYPCAEYRRVCEAIQAGHPEAAGLAMSELLDQIEMLQVNKVAQAS